MRTWLALVALLLAARGGGGEPETTGSADGPDSSAGEPDDVRMITEAYARFFDADAPDPTSDAEVQRAIGRVDAFVRDVCETAS